MYFDKNHGPNGRLQETIDMIDQNVENGTMEKCLVFNPLKVLTFTFEWRFCGQFQIWDHFRQIEMRFSLFLSVIPTLNCAAGKKTLLSLGSFG